MQTNIEGLVSCGLVIKIEKEDLKKNIENKELKFSYTITSSIKEHVCLKDNKINENLENPEN